MSAIDVEGGKERTQEGPGHFGSGGSKYGKLYFRLPIIEHILLAMPSFKYVLVIWNRENDI